MRFIYIAFLGCLFMVSSCNNAAITTSNSQTAPVAQAPVQSKLGDASTRELMATVNKYYGLKNALVAGKAARADSAATELATTAEQTLTAFKKDTINGNSMQPYMDTIINYSKIVSATKDETCERQRIPFEVISRNVYAALKAADLKNAHIYHQYCPMAFNEKGAYWLSSESEILNPYFGKKMLECGEVTDSL